jgi:hypothetical protein
MASHGQQYHPQYNVHTPHTTHFHTQPHGNAFTPSYTTQPLQHEPWNGQGPSRSPMTPRTGGVIFDAMTDPNFGDYLPYTDVASWTMNSTDPNYLVSPSEHSAPPQERFFNMAAQNMVQQNLVYRPQLSIPQSQPQPQQHMHHISQTEIQWTRTSPPPDQNNFVNYDASSTLFTDSYITDQRQPPSSANIHIRRINRPSVLPPEVPAARLAFSRFILTLE